MHVVSWETDWKKGKPEKIYRHSCLTNQKWRWCQESTSPITSVDWLAGNCRWPLQEDQPGYCTWYYFKPWEILEPGLGEVYKPMNGCGKEGEPPEQTVGGRQKRVIKGAGHSFKKGQVCTHLWLSPAPHHHSLLYLLVVFAKSFLNYLCKISLFNLCIHVLQGLKC